MLNLKIQDLDDVTVVQCAGRIMAEDADSLRNAVVKQRHTRVVVLDLAQVGAVDAAGLGMLVSLRIWVNATGKQLKLMNLAPRVEEIMELTNLKSAFEFCSVQEMFGLLCRATHLSRFAAPLQAASAP